jgi:hypothetical protein
VLHIRVLAPLAVLLAAHQLAAQQEKGSLNKYGNPMKIAPRPTSAAITEADLRTRLYIFADDSMLGRGAGTIGNKKGTDYIAAELRRLGLEPAGDNGTYFQALPFGYRVYTSESQLTAGNQSLRFGEDFAPTPAGQFASTTFANAQVIYGGIAGDTAEQIAPSLAAGRVVLLMPGSSAAAPTAGRGAGGGARGGAGGGGARGTAGGGGAGGRAGGRGGQFGAGPRFAGALATITVDLDGLSAAQRTAINQPPARSTLMAQPAAVVPGAILGPPPAPPQIRVTRAAAERLMGVSLDSLRSGAAGHQLNGRLVLREERTPDFARNVVAIIRGSDPVLKNQYVAIGAHNDHNPPRQGGVDHDSLKAFNDALYALRMADGKTVQPATDSMRRLAVSHINIDELRRKLGPARLDSISNGADDDGSGSMAVLEIAEAFALSKVRPKRSIIFVWHTGEETGLQGSRYFTDNPTVPRDSIVAQINIDMIGRGRADDLPGGGPDYLAVVGSKRLSSDLSNMVEATNKQQKRPLKLDYQFDQDVTWNGYQNIYGRSDHFNYARYNIPIAFFFTGLHGDYHQLTDEPQYIDYPHYSRITNYIHDLMNAVANSAQRPRVDRVSQ